MEEKLNMQIPENTDLLSPLQRLNLMDDFLFDIATSDLGVCKVIIELSLGITIKRIRWKEGQKVVRNVPGKRGIRMDFYVEDDSGRIINVEMQKRNEGNIPKRTRFYQALIDAPLLQSGEKSFDKLNPTYIVIICGFDLYGRGLYKYTFENMCHEVPELVLGDECRKLILNTRGKNHQETEQSLIDFLHYVEDSTAGSIPPECDERLRYLHERVEKIKSDRQIGVTYMKMEERDRLLRVEGEEKKLIEQVCKKMKKGKPVQTIADELEEDTETIQAICQIACELAPDYDRNIIFNKLHNYE